MNRSWTAPSAETPAVPSARIAVVTDDPGWHGATLQTALAARGAESIFVSLTQAQLQLGGSNPPLSAGLPGFGPDLPTGVFVRGIPGGTLEQVVLRLDVLHLLREAGVPVCNDARAIERTVDKAMTSALLHRAGLPTPQTWVCETEPAARAVLRAATAAGRELVLKPLFGSQGQGLQRLSREDQLPPPDQIRGVYYLQEFIHAGGADYRDWRVLVVDGRAIARMCRRSRHWITNRAQGATCERLPQDPELDRLAEAAAHCIDIDYAGVDLLQDSAGRFLVSEVNGVPAWMGLQSVSSVDIADRLAALLLARIERAAAPCRAAMP